jgi:hypothetical protein
MARVAARKIEKKVESSTTLLEAAKKVLRQNGYAGCRPATWVCGRRPLEPDPRSLRSKQG